MLVAVLVLIDQLPLIVPCSRACSRARMRLDLYLIMAAVQQPVRHSLVALSPGSFEETDCQIGGDTEASRQEGR